MENTNQPHTWQELLLAAGYLPTQLTPNTFRLRGETCKNIRDLYEVLRENVIPNTMDNETLTIDTPAPSLENWLKMLAKYQVHNSEGENMEGIRLRCLDIPMRGMIRQFYRLGIKTCFSCSGHPNYSPPNTFPCVGFYDRQDLTMASGLFNANKLRRLPNLTRLPLHWFFDTTPETLVEFGIKLNSINTLKEVTMGKSNAEEILLTMLLNLPGVSGKEETVRQFLLPQLINRLDTAWQDDTGNLLGTRKFGNGPTVLLSAHMDVVADLAAGSQIVKNGCIWSRSEGILGADDRAGIAMTLLLLDDLNGNGFDGTIKVAFTVHEEDGQLGAIGLDPSFYKDVKIAVSLDRKNGGDIIIRSLGRTYGPIELGELFETTSKELWGDTNNYTITDGGVSDLRVWSSKGVPSLNLSVGFRDEHSQNETLNLEDWRRTRQLVLHVLTTKKIGELSFSKGENNVWL